MNNLVFGILITFLLLFLVILFCIILIKIYISKIKKYNQILYQKEIDQQKAITQAILEAQEDVLTNIAEELHDDAGQQLTCINFQLENLKLTNPAIKNDIMPLTESLNHLDNSIRTLSHSINSQKFKNYRLVDAIKNEIEKINKLNVISCQLSVNKNVDYTFSTNESIVLFRIFQELLNNALKHSQAKTFSIIIKQNSNLCFIFKDDGIGFSEEKIDLMKSTGIQNVKNRSQLIGFSIEISSVTNKGTTIKLCKT